MTGRVVRVWVDEREPDRIQFLVVKRHGRARRAYAERGTPLFDLLARRLPQESPI